MRIFLFYKIKIQFNLNFIRHFAVNAFTILFNTKSCMDRCKTSYLWIAMTVRKCFKQEKKVNNFTIFNVHWRQFRTISADVCIPETAPRRKQSAFVDYKNLPRLCTGTGKSTQVSKICSPRRGLPSRRRCKSLTRGWISLSLYKIVVDYFSPTALSPKIFAFKNY